MDAKLSIYDFGKRLLETLDLDPVYVVLHGANLEPETLRRWLLAYWGFYHSGTASWITDVRTKDEGAYWSRMEQAAASKAWPRSPERRHFRGANAIKSVAFLKGKGVDRLFFPFVGGKIRGATLSASEVMKYVQTWVGFGPWIAFKVADMLERLGIVKVQFSVQEALYESPLEGAKLLWEQCNPGINSDTEPGGVGAWAIDAILSELRNYSAPPGLDRIINAQEAETILCKWKSYMNGHYHIGEDIASLRSGLLRFGRCKTSQRLLAAGKEGGLW